MKTIIAIAFFSFSYSLNAQDHRYLTVELDGDQKEIILSPGDINGSLFRYLDGVARAWHNVDEVRLAERYIIHTPASTAKISFNANNGEIWWKLDPSEE